MIFFQEHCRLAVTFVTPICAVDGRNWKEMDSAGGVAMKNPIKQAWRAAEAVRKTIKNALGTGAYVIPVVVFVNMAENADITAALGGSQVKLVWKIQDLVERFVALPEENQLQPQLNTDLIEDETLALGWAPEASPTAKAAAAKTPTDLSDLGPEQSSRLLPARRHRAHHDKSTARLRDQSAAPGVSFTVYDEPKRSCPVVSDNCQPVPLCQELTKCGGKIRRSLPDVPTGTIRTSPASSSCCRAFRERSSC